MAAGIVSATFNYLVVRRFIFEAKGPHSVTLPKYATVHGIGLLLRYAIFEGLIRFFHIPPKHWAIVFLAKPVADLIVYSLKYVIQRDFVFKTTRSAVPESDRSGSRGALESIRPESQPQSEPLR